MSRTLTAPTTALAVLFGSDAEESARGLTAALERSPALGQAMRMLPAVSRLATHAVATECSRVAAPLLRLDVGHVLLAGWRTRSELVTAARETAAHPGTVDVVPLRQHRITAERHPRLDILVDGNPVVSLRFTVLFDFDVTELAATVQNGALTDLRAGRTKVTVTLRVSALPEDKGVKLAEQDATIEVPLVVPLGRGIPLQRVPSPTETATPASGLASAG
jgi:hypothetical protein